MKQLIRRILREEFKNLSSVIEELLQPTVDRYSDYVCEVQVFQNVMNPKKYSLRVIFVGGPGSKIWPTTQAVQSSREKVMKDMWETIFRFTGLSVELDSSTVTECKDSKKEEPIEEGLHDTFWQNDYGDKVTLLDLLDATEDIPVKNIPVEKIKSKLLTWDDDDKEVAKIEKADLQYPILIFVDDDNKFISIIDGHHRAQKAVRHKLKTIKAKIIPINSLPKDVRKVFGHLGKQEQNESELTERCWKGYTQKGMKTMFGKRYPNCVKVKKKRVNEASLGDHLKKLLNFKGDEKREFQKIVDIITKITKKEYPVEGMVGVAVTNVEKKMWGQNFNNPKSVGLRWDFAVTIRPLFTQYNPNNSEKYGEKVLKFQDEFINNAYGMGFNISSPIGHEKVKDYRINFNWDRPINVKQVEL